MSRQLHLSPGAEFHAEVHRRLDEKLREHSTVPQYVTPAEYHVVIPPEHRRG